MYVVSTPSRPSWSSGTLVCWKKKRVLSPSFHMSSGWWSGNRFSASIRRSTVLVVLSFGGVATEECLALYRKEFAAVTRLLFLVACAGLVAAASRALSNFDLEFFIFESVGLVRSVYDMVRS